MTLLTYQQAAAELNVSEHTVRRLVDDQALPSVAIRRARRIRPADLQAFIDGLATVDRRGDTRPWLRARPLSEFRSELRAVS